MRLIKKGRIRNRETIEGVEQVKFYLCLILVLIGSAVNGLFDGIIGGIGIGVAVFGGYLAGIDIGKKGYEK